MKRYVVYKHTDPEGKVYIGMTGRKPRKRFDYGRGYQHNARFRAAIEKYGWDGLKHEVLMDNLTIEEAETAETALIAEYKSTDPRYGYNVKTGGSHGTGISEETRKKLSESIKGDNNPTRRFGHPMLGKKHSEESRKKMSESAKARTDRVVSSETKNKLRLVQKKKAVRDLETGAIYYGIHEAAEATGLSATKICAVCKGRRHRTGGKRWEYFEGE